MCPVYFIHFLYWVFSVTTILKYANYTVIIGKIVNDNSSDYIAQIGHFVEWCKTNYLYLNVKKTKMIIIDFRNNLHVPDLIRI